MANKKYYAVAQGRKPGIYNIWSDEFGAEEQVKGFAGAKYKGFATLTSAKKWFQEVAGTQAEIFFLTEVDAIEPEAKPERQENQDHQAALEAGKVVLYTDGGSIDNPGPGGYGVVLLRGNTRQEFSAGYRLTTNNRMELMACIVGLQALKEKSSVVLYSDSKYVVEGINKGWAKRWRANRWMRTNKTKAVNSDLWKILLIACDRHNVEFMWVKGHAGNPGNERCDQLSKRAARGNNLPPDSAFESRDTNLTLFDI